MPKKNTKQVQGKLETIQTGPITVDKSGSVVIKINAKPGAKNNNITGTLYYYYSIKKYVNFTNYCNNQTFYFKLNFFILYINNFLAKLIIILHC